MSKKMYYVLIKYNRYIDSSFLIFIFLISVTYMYAAKKKIQSKENMVMQKHDIVTILGSESNRNGSQNSHSKVASELDIWSSILTQKNKDEASQSKPPPYIHPLVKSSKNYLSENSLKICTESLGSETGSDGFSSSYTSFEDNNSKDDEKNERNNEHGEETTLLSSSTSFTHKSK